MSLKQNDEAMERFHQMREEWLESHGMSEANVVEDEGEEFILVGRIDLPPHLQKSNITYNPNE
jgi:hypothetical protein